MSNTLRMKSGDGDRRSRIQVYLIAAHQPFHRDFYCSTCGQKVCEIDDMVVYLTDTADIRSVPVGESGAVTVKCVGKYCRTYYEFVLRAKKFR